MASTSGTAAASTTMQEKLDEGVPALLAKHHVASVSIARIDDGKQSFAAAYGEQKPGTPATIRTLYNVASLTKPISAEVMLRLAAQGRLSLDEPMAPVWTDPDIATDARRDRLTPRLALSHQTGFANWRRETDGVLKFVREPGTQFGYSGEGYEYVAHFAQKKVGGDFEALAQKLVFDPAGMYDSAYTRRPWFDGRIAIPVGKDGKNLEPSIGEHFLASDLLYTTPSDYARFVIGLMNDEGETPAIASERAKVQVSRKSEMCPPEKSAHCPQEVGMGLGWEVFRFKDDRYLMHTGRDDGVFTLVFFSPQRRSGTVIFTSSDNGASVVLPILELIGQEREYVDFLRDLAG